MGCKLFVANLPSNATGAALQKAFAPYGVVKWADVAIDTQTMQCKGFGFVQMASEQDADRAATGLSGRSFQGKRIVVSESKKSPRTASTNPIHEPVPLERQRRQVVVGRSHHRSPRRG
jgi:transformer-2 protein